MNKRNLLVILGGILMSGTLAWGDDFPWEMKLPFKEATIQYQLSGSEQGEEILYIKDSGRRRAKYHKAQTTLMGMTNTTETVEITDPDWVCTYDLAEKTGTKVSNPHKLYLAEYTKLSSSEKKNFEKNAKEFGTGMMQQMGGSITRSSGTVLGHDCEVVSVSNGMSTVYTLRGTDLPLRSETSIMGMKHTSVATKIDTGSPIPDKVFSPPAGITAKLNQQAETMMAGSIHQMVESFIKPDGARKMQQAGPFMMMGPAMQQAMEAEGMSAEEQQETMRQMQEAMEQMRQRQPRR